MLALASSACGHAGYRGAVTVHATIDLLSSTSISGPTCRGVGPLAEYAAGDRLLLVDQHSQPVAVPILRPGATGPHGCLFRFTAVLPKGAQSLWLPKSELGIPDCTASQPGAALYDRSATSTAAVSTTLGLPPKVGPHASGDCSALRVGTLSDASRCSGTTC